ncbi:serine-rich adhesin for platelets-like protein [Senna tora]|uniref:Serine-rich adhesin for platelets-like protein n=1 Tax=Senna tora TaxID=362788 RepID=A0A834TMY6_9FABA|nr:serine-rich adhesin for platelets-like protein [Senna tora]
MASLTPGVLSKLLDAAGNKHARVAGEHRSPLLQVIEIVPCFAGGDDPWQSRGYFLKVSDSRHSAYVSISDEDVDLIYSDKIQLGQFVYVTRFDPASPVPILRGLKPVPNRRPCVGNPVDLNSSESLPIVGNLDFRKPKKGAKKMGGSNGNDGEKVRLKKGSPLKNSGFEVRRLSLDSARRGWDQSSSSQFKSKSSKTSSSPSNVIDKKVSKKNDSPLKSPTSMISPLKNKNENLSPKTTSTTVQRKSMKSPPCAGNVPGHLVKVPLNLKARYDPSTKWDTLPPTLSNLGKKVASHRNIAFFAAVRALEEASAEDSVIQCMCVFAELCQSCGTIPAGSLVERFLDLHLNLQTSTSLFDSLLTETKPSEDVCRVPTNKNAITWVQAAVETNLSKFNLFRTQPKSEALNGEKCHYVVMEKDAPEETNTEKPSVPNKQNRATQVIKRVPSSKRQLLVAKNNKDSEKADQPRESGLKEAASLAEKLLAASREWFLKYLEDSLDSGFGVIRSDEEGKSSEMACLLGHLKKVNHWLDDLVGGGEKVDCRVENLRKRLYGFLLEHVNSAIVSTK